MTILENAVSDRKRAEETLRESEARFRTAVKNTNFVLSQFDRDLKYTWIHNPHPDFDASLIIGKRSEELEDSDGMRQLTALKRQVVESGKGVREENSFSRSDGVHTYDTTVEPLFDDAGAVIGGVVSALDITERKDAEAVLQVSESRFNNVLDKFTDAFTIFDSKMRFVYVNDETAKRVGMSKEQLIGHVLWEVWPSLVGSIQYDNYMKTMDDKTPRTFIAHPVFADMWQEYRAFPWDDGIAVFARDITERKRVEEALLESEKKYRSIVETAGEGIVIARPDGAYFYVNQRMADMLGYPVDEILGRSSSDFTFDDYRPQVLQARKDLWKGDVLHGEFMFRRKDGSVLWSLYNATPIFNDKGEHVANMAMHTDNTERKRAEDALRESEDKYRTIVDTANEGIWMIDNNARTTFVNMRMAEMLGYKPEEMIGKRSFDFMDEETRAVSEIRLKQRRQGKRDNPEVKYVRKDGSYLWTISSSTPYYDEAGNFMGVFGMVTDITERKRAEEALNASRQRINEILDSIQDDFYVLDRDWNFVFTSRSFTSRIGKKPKDFIGNNIWEMFPKHLGTVLEENYRAAMDKREIRRFELHGQYTDLWYRMTAFPSVEGITLLGTDITESKRAEEVLQASENRYHTLFTSMDEGFALCDIICDESGVPCDYRILEVNNAYEIQTGLKAVDVLGKTVMELFPGFEHSWIEIYGKVALTGESIRFENYNHNTGRHYEAYSYRPSKGKFALLFTDITKRKRIEEAMQLSEEKFRLISTNSPDSMSIQDKDLRYEWVVNPALDWTPEFMIGKTDKDLIDPEQYALVSALKQKVIDTGHEMHVQVPLTDKQGKTFIYDGAYIPRRDANGNITGVLCYFRDVTERTRYEDELKEAKQQAELYLDLMGHDISNMHQVAMGQLELAQDVIDTDGKLEAANREMIDASLQSLWRSAKLIDNVRKLQKIRSNTVKNTDISLDEVLSGSINQYDGSYPDKSIKVDYGEGPYIVKANELLRDVFTNLIGNAIKHSNGSKVDIQIKLENTLDNGKKFFMISIEDNGPGITDDMKDNVFNRLQRGETKARGMGLGLYLVKSLVESYNGKVWVEDRVQGDYKKGSKFVVILPAVEK